MDHRRAGSVRRGQRRRRDPRASLLFALLVTRGRPDLLEWQRSGDFYDAQAHAWLAGRWSIPDGVLSIEKFLHDGHAYMYQGPFPALLRAADRRRHHPLRRPPHPALDAPRRDAWRWSASPACTGGCGAWCARTRRCAEPTSSWRPWRRSPSAAGRPSCTRPSRLVGVPRGRHVGRRLDASSASTPPSGACSGPAGAVPLGRHRRPRSRCARAHSVALGAVAALAIIAGGNVVLRSVRAAPTASRCLGRLQWAASAPRPDGTFPVAAPALAALVPVAVYAAVNYIKFATLFSIPFYSQGFTLEDARAPPLPRRQRRHPVRAEVGAHHRRAVRPPGRPPLHRGVSLRRLPARRLARSAACSSTSSTTRAACRRRCRSSPSWASSACGRSCGSGAANPAPGWPPCAAPRWGGWPVVSRSSRSPTSRNRYLADLVPALVITGLIGVHALLARTSRADARPPAAGRCPSGEPWAFLLHRRPLDQRVAGADLRAALQLRRQRRRRGGVRRHARTTAGRRSASTRSSPCAPTRRSRTTPAAVSSPSWATAMPSTSPTACR